MTDLVEKMLRGDVRALSLLISLVENKADNVPDILGRIYHRTGRGYSIGITGPLGGGKSTLVSSLTSVMRGKGLSVGIIAVDPTSPFSGGALLGDRIRMEQHSCDDGVFIRSMASRGHGGGLSETVYNVTKLLDAFGKDMILVETVGAGQTDVDIRYLADTTVVVLVPESGDSIQAMKGGLMEIADIFVVNKADRDGAEAMVSELLIMFHQGAEDPGWQVPIVATQAIHNTGIKDLFAQIERHRKFLGETGRLNLRRRERRRKEFFAIIENEVIARSLKLIKEDNRLMNEVEKIIEDQDLDPYNSAGEFIKSVFPNLV